MVDCRLARKQEGEKMPLSIIASLTTTVNNQPDGNDQLGR